MTANDVINMVLTSCIILLLLKIVRDDRLEKKHNARVDELKAESHFFAMRYNTEGCWTCRRRAIRAHNKMVDEMISFWGAKQAEKWEKLKIREEAF